MHQNLTKRMILIIWTNAYFSLDSVSSSSSISSISKATLEVRAAPGDNSDLPDTTALTSSTVHFDPTGAEGVRSLVCESSTEQVSTTEQNHDSCQNTDDIPGINSGPRLDEDEKDNLKTEDSTDDGIDSSENVTVRKEVFSRLWQGCFSFTCKRLPFKAR